MTAPGSPVLPGADQTPAGQAMLVGAHPAPVEGRTVDLAAYNDLADLIEERDRARDTACALEAESALVVARLDLLLGEIFAVPIEGSAFNTKVAAEAVVTHAVADVLVILGVLPEDKP